MHCSSLEIESDRIEGGDIMVAIAAMVTEGRIPGKLNSKSRGFYEGPHCPATKSAQDHRCVSNDNLCKKYDGYQKKVLSLWNKSIPLCVEVLLIAACSCEDSVSSVPTETSQSSNNALLLEQWYFNVSYRRPKDVVSFTFSQLVNAIRSQLHFSQIAAWLSIDSETTLKLSNKNLQYKIVAPGETFETSKFTSFANKHEFPPTEIGNSLIVHVTYYSLPRTSTVPTVECSKCTQPSIKRKTSLEQTYVKKVWDDRMHTSCTLKGKHRCEDFEEDDALKRSNSAKFADCGKENSNSIFYNPIPSTSSNNNKAAINENVNIFLRDKEEKNSQHRKLSYIASNSECLPVYSVGTPNLQVAHACSKTKGIDILCDQIRQQNAKNHKYNTNDLTNQKNKGQILLDAILRSGKRNTTACDNGEQHSGFANNKSCSAKTVEEIEHSVVVGEESANAEQCGSDSNISTCDNLSESDIFNIKNNANYKIYDDNCDSQKSIPKYKKMRDISNIDIIKNSSYVPKSNARQKLLFVDCNISNKEARTSVKDENYTTDAKDSTNSGIEIPTALEQAKFRKNLDNAASMVFHSRTGLPLTSSPAPVRRGKSCFDFDSTINSVSAIKSALFSSSFSTDDDSESDGSIVSPCSPDAYSLPLREPPPVKYRRGHANSLLGSFEESVLNGRLEPVSTVQGFRAELGASGSFVPKHLVVPVTVFFYTLGDNDKVSSPYLGHINLGRKGYNVPKSGTVQVTLFNPLGTVVKMFVIMYDLSDMPCNSQTFIRQRTLYMPTNCKDDNLEWSQKWLRYLIHLRFMSSKSGRIYLHSDVRMIIFRKSDLDTATAHGIDMCYELRSFTHMPSNPRFSPRK